MIDAAVLVVDDEPLVREATGRCSGQKVTSCSWLGLTKRSRFSLTASISISSCSDVRMPHKDGFSLAVEVRATHPQIPFVFITGYMLSPERDAALGRVLWKPFK
jgi:CheY-like chemotaxis protein